MAMGRQKDKEKERPDNRVRDRETRIMRYKETESRRDRVARRLRDSEIVL